MKKIYMIFKAIFMCALVTNAQTVSYTTISSTYSENFNGLANSGSTVITTSNGPSEIQPATFSGSTVSGWYLQKSGGSGSNISLVVDNGASNSGAAFSYGTTASTERALGVLASGTKIHRFGVVITNNTASELVQFTVNFTGEQWRLGQTPTNGDTLTFGYKVNASNINDVGFTTNSALDIVSLFTTGTPGALDGNAPANRRTYTATIGVILPIGSTLTLRWDDINDTGSDDGLAIDDFSFSAIDATLLPLNLNSFNAVKTNNGNLISWSTANEVNVQSINIERSVDGRNFSQLTKLAAGNTTYQYTDATPVKGTNYYRLKIVDKDGSSKLSKVVAVINSGNGAIVTGVYPTITTGKLTVDVVAEGTQNLQFVFTDLQGRTTTIRNVIAVTGNNTISLDASALANGMYLVKMLQGNKEATSFKIVKQ